MYTLLLLCGATGLKHHQLSEWEHLCFAVLDKRNGMRGHSVCHVSGEIVFYLCGGAHRQRADGEYSTVFVQLQSCVICEVLTLSKMSNAETNMPYSTINVYRH
jgi:hypothetical protein